MPAIIHVNEPHADRPHAGGPHAGGSPAAAGRPLPPRWRRKLARRLAPLSGTLLRRGVFRRVRGTAPLPTDPAAEVEVHSLVCHRDVDLYLIAVKSLLRFHPALAVAVHDDGTLTAADRELILRHLPGVEVIGRAAADAVVTEALRRWPECLRFRAARVNSFQVFDYNLLARRSRLISLDSDVLFLREPEEMLEWLAAESRDVLYNQEPEGTQIGRTLRRLGIPCHGDLNSGFLAYPRDMVDYGLVEASLVRLRGEAKGGYAQGYLDLCLHRSPCRARPLPPERYQIYTGQSRRDLEPAVMVHFISYLRYAQLHYPRLALRICRELDALPF